jgi:ADP-heptose:LPS heptosyltransferase
MNRVLVIKLSALGDFIIATSGFQAVHNYHKTAHITLLTTKLYEDFAQSMGVFDEIWVDERPKITQPLKLLNFRQKLRQANFDRIYDFQGVDRTALYHRLLGPGKKPEWVGTVQGCSHYISRVTLAPHYHQDRVRMLLAAGGINELPELDVRSYATSVDHFNLPRPYALLVPGASQAHGDWKKWSPENYANVAQFLTDQGIYPVIIGGPSDDNSAILKLCSSVIDLTGKTTFQEVIGLAKEAVIAIGNDTGPMHIAAASHCPVVVLFSGQHKPEVVGPRGKSYVHLQVDHLKDLSSSKVIEAIQTSFLRSKT